MASFDRPRQSTREALIQFADRTITDDLSDVSWLTGKTKAEAQVRYLEKYGQYFDNGRRVTR